VYEGARTIAVSGGSDADRTPDLLLWIEQVDPIPQYRVMVFLAEGSAGASALAGTLAVRRPAITVVVHGLVAKGFVQRQGDAVDRRKVHHRLTPAGRRALERADGLVSARLAELTEHLDAADAPRAVEGLTLWGQAMAAARKAAASRA
jgi:DNA-binding MarR family transcriptional regulator